MPSYELVTNILCIKSKIYFMSSLCENFFLPSCCGDLVTFFSSLQCHLLHRHRHPTSKTKIWRKPFMEAHKLKINGRGGVPDVTKVLWGWCSIFGFIAFFNQIIWKNFREEDPYIPQTLLLLTTLSPVPPPPTCQWKGWLKAKRGRKIILEMWENVIQ